MTNNDGNLKAFETNLLTTEATTKNVP